ncbi:MAG: PspC domain-containing protein [Nocardioidaceae bacterium]
MSETPPADGGGFDPGRLRTAPTQMRRSRDDRYIAGVCGGLARYLNVDPVVVRVIMAALTVIGGVGLVLYGAAWLLAPEEGAEKNVLESHLPASPRIRALGWVAAGVIAVIAVVSSGPWFDWGWIGPLPLLGIAVLIWVLARPRSSGSAEPAAPTTPAPPHPGTSAPPPPTSAAPDASAPSAPGTSTPASPVVAAEGPPSDPDALTAVVPTDEDRTMRLPTTRPATAPVPAEPPPASADPTDAAPPEPPPVATPTVAQPTPPSAKRKRFDPTLTWLTLAALVAVIGVLSLIDQTATDVSGPVYLATSLAVVAVGMLAGTWWGNGRWLIPIGAVLTMLLVGVSQLPVWKFGEIDEAPTSAADVLPSYEMGAGQILLDLTRVEDLTALDGRTIQLENGLGQTRVFVPEDLDVSVHAELNAGDIKIFDREANGADASTQYTDPDDLDPNLRIEIDGSLGQIEVIRR